MGTGGNGGELSVLFELRFVLEPSRWNVRLSPSISSLTGGAHERMAVEKGKFQFQAMKYNRTHSQRKREEGKEESSTYQY